MKNKLDSLFFNRLFVSERKQIALMADEKPPARISHRLFAINRSEMEIKLETRKEQKERRRQEILCAALELFVTKGYAATKVTDIAKRANMSTGLMFHYFESKEKLYEELIRMGLEGTAYPAEQKCEHAIDFFVQFTTQLFEYMKKQPVMARMFLLMAQAQRNEATPAHIREIAMQVNTIEEFVPIIAWGQQEGTIRDGEPKILSNAFWCCIQGIAERYATNQEIDLPQPEWIVDIVRKK